jgi:tetratricopeptide (TPR) repeat protein
VAKTHIEAALKISKDSPDALVVRGRLAMEERDYDRAIADFRSVLRQHPRSVEYMGLLARVHMQNKEPALARELLFRAAKNNPGHISIRTLFAEYLTQSRDYKAALEEVDAMAAMFPFEPAIQRLRQLVESGQNSLAGSDAQLAGIENDLPENAAVYSRQGKQYLEQKNFDNAIGEFQKALRVAPSAIEPLKGMVQAYLAQGRPDLALARVNAQLRITSPTLHQAYFLLGQIYDGQNQPSEAQRAYQKALDINAAWDAPYLALARQHHARGDNKRALSVLETARNTLPGSETIALHVAAMLEANQQFDRAMAEYEKLLMADADLDVAANNLAVLLLDRRGDKASVERALTLARRFQNSAQPAYLDTLGWALVKSGQASRGLPYLEKALAAMPDAPTYHYHAGWAYKAIGEKEKAKTHLLKAIATGVAFSGRDQAKSVVATL